MRSDMFELIIERPRHHGGKRKLGRAGERAVMCADDAPHREPPVGMSRGGTKGLSENLAPLRRFLQGCVGRRWDAVWSELCAHIAFDDPVQKHVLDHVRRMVLVDVVLIDGLPYRSEATGTGGEEHLRVGARRYADELYVCPRTGLLRAAPPLGRRRGWGSSPAVLHDLRRLDEAHDLRQIEGIWYRIAFARTPQGFDACLPSQRPELPGLLPGGFETAEAHHRRGWYANGKRQLSSRELRSSEIRRLVEAEGLKVWGGRCGCRRCRGGRDA